MSDFGKAFDYMIRNEDFSISGVVTPEPGGGKARLGINSIANPKAVTDGFYEMPLDQALTYAKKFYYDNYWINNQLDVIPFQRVSTKLLDMAVNLGNGGMRRILQRALGVPETMKMDEPTIIGLGKADNSLVPVLVDKLTAYYQSIYDKNPAKYAGVLKGWLGRAKKIPQ